MNRISGRKIFFLFFIFIALKTQSQAVANHVNASDSSLWQQSVGTLLEEPLWKTRDAYDSGNVLMIPLHHAFLTSDRTAIQKFEVFFRKMARQEIPEGQINQVHITYLASQYLSLKKKFGYELNQAMDVYLIKRVLKYVNIKWNHDVAFQWGKAPFFGLKNRVNYALEKSIPKNEPSYYRVITDYELFLFAIASDISFVTKDLNYVDEQDRAMLQEMNKYLITILERRGSFTEYGGWIFQVGFWTDHQYFEYSGNLKLEENLKPLKVANITNDSSHSLRWPLWISSYKNANESNVELLSNIYSAFSIQFKDRIAAKHKKRALMNNFIDGYNGIYRYKYETTGGNSLKGYGPYNLSGSLGMAWYCFLNDVNSFYKFYKDTYPLSKETLNIYVGPNTTRDRNKLLKWPEFFTNGFAELIAEQAYDVSINYKF